MRIIIKKSLLFLIIASILFLISVPVRASSTTTGNATYVEEEKLDKEDIGYGVSYYKSVGETSATIRSGTYNQTVYYLNTVCNKTIKVIPWAKFENNKWKLANVRELIADFEAKNPGWMVLAGVNADFFDINALNPLPYQPNNGQAFEGNIYRTSGKSYNSTIGIKNDGSVDSLIGQSVPPVKANMTLDVFDKNEEVVASFDIENINTAPDDDETAVFFGIYNSSHNYESKSIPTTPGAMVFYVEEADLALPNSATDFYGKGTITSYNAFSMAVGQFSVATKNQAVKDALAIGVKIRVQREWTGQFADVEYAIGGGTLLLSDGEAPNNVNTAASVMNTNHPRTAIGRKDDGSIVMAVVDGRIDESVSRGVYGDELAAIMKHAGCVEAYNLDGGGSSTMVVRENDEFVIKNVLSENYERRVGNCLLVVTKAPEYEV
ncbi:MAG: phosphodiester glycosidase family protein, partial [Bacilli bacterium]|nr:phosphodiester glycosidase family protein [Bacilli bacterium]